MNPSDRGISLPKKRTDGETLQDNLTENAYFGVLPSRYLKKDENGEPIEAQEELFRRVGKNNAVAEAVYHDTETYIDARHIKPDHPRRDELRADVLDMAGQDEFPVKLTEDNAKHVAYDALIDDVSDDTRETMEAWADRYTAAMENLSFMPNTPTLINAGSELQQLSACFVNSPEDDISDIHETAKEAAEIFQSGGGNGYAFSHLRPYGDIVGSTGGIASGPITFMRTYDQLCETIAQGGARRGAQMGVMNVTHPDIPYFIHAKRRDVSLAETLRLNDPDDFTHNSFGDALDEARDLIDDEGRVPHHLRNAVEGHLSNFNISVGITTEFMEALKAGEDFDLINPRTGEQHIATEETKEMYGWFDLGEYVTVGEPLSIPAEKLWTRIVEGAHQNGEPGVVFIDRMNEMHSFADLDGDNSDYKIHATNPCSEQPLCENEACNLGHINLSTLVAKDAPDWREFRASDWEELGEVEQQAEVQDYLTHAIDWEELNTRIETGTRFLDNVVTMSNFPNDAISERVGNLRKIGLGIMGYHQMIIQMGVRYGSDEGNQIARQVMQHINHRSKAVSHELANDRGNFAAWDDSKYANPTENEAWFSKLVGQDASEYEDGFGVRNHNTTTIAPTGTTSMVGNTTGGCEPIYNVAYYKNVSDDVQGDEMLVEFDDYFLRVLKENDVDVDAVKAQAEEQMEANEFDGIDGLTNVPDAIGELFVTTNQLTAKEHADVLCAFQDGVDSAISKTINAPKHATVAEAENIFEYIYDHGGKSVTFYRDGSRSKQVLTTRKENKESADADAEEVTAEYLQEELGVSLEEVETLVGVASNAGVGQSQDEGDATTVTDGGVTAAQSAENNVPMCEECNVPLEISEGCEKCPECGAGQCSF